MGRLPLFAVLLCSVMMFQLKSDAVLKRGNDFSQAGYTPWAWAELFGQTEVAQRIQALPITAHHCPSLPITAHHCPSLPITAHHCPFHQFEACVQASLQSGAGE